MTAVEWLIERLMDGKVDNKMLAQALEMEKQQQDEFAIVFLRWYCIEALQNQKYLALSIFELLEIYKK
jgi:hypothetical protein